MCTCLPNLFRPVAYSAPIPLIQWRDRVGFSPSFPFHPWQRSIAKEPVSSLFSYLYRKASAVAGRQPANHQEMLTAEVKILVRQRLYVDRTYIPVPLFGEEIMLLGMGTNAV